MSELRVGNLPLRDLPAIAKDPTQMPLSAEIGMLAAGIAQAGSMWTGPQAGGDLYTVSDLVDLKQLRTRFPVNELPGEPLPALWHWQGVAAKTLKPRMATGQD
jgi:hypothetical protein